MDENWKMRHIPAFGDWEYVNDLPITQYFESATHAGLLRYSSSSASAAASSAYAPPPPALYSYSADLYAAAAHLHNHPRPKQILYNDKFERTLVKVGSSKKQAGKVFDVTATELPPPAPAPAAAKRRPPAVKKQQQQFQYDAGLDVHHRRAPKAVDEDLYKIPPELLKKRKRRLGFISRCLVPPCGV